MYSSKMKIRAILLLSSTFAAGSALAGVAGSKHDMGSGGASLISGANPLGGTTEVCVFCHTPHGSDISAAVPLWNKTLPDPASYTRYSSLQTSTLDGDEATVGSVSIACLSCHDGTQAMDAVINAPGSGLGGFGTGTPGLEMGTVGAAPVPNLGVDLRDDHPISIEYAGGACATAVPGACDPAIAPTGDPDFRPAAFATINSNPQWWVDTAGGTANRDKTDMILYTRLSGDGNITTTGPAVECASCHDPHNDTSTPVSFLRIDNSNSDVCLACHIK